MYLYMLYARLIIIQLIILYDRFWDEAWSGSKRLLYDDDVSDSNISSSILSLVGW